VEQQDDIELLRAYQRGADESAFMRLVERHSGWIFAAARRRLRDDHLADDAVQGVYVVLASKASQLVESKRGSLSAWLFHVMHFTCARLLRSQSRRAAFEELAGPALARDDADRLFQDGELLLLMEDSIAQLPALEREMVVRRFYQRESFAEIGSALNITSEAARKRVSRALGTVKAQMMRNGPDAIPDSFLTDLNRSALSARDRKKQASNSKRIDAIVKGKVTMAEQQQTVGGYNLISVEFLVRDVEANLEFFEKLGFPRRWMDKPDAMGRLPRASLTAGTMGKIWVRRAAVPDIRPSSSINPFFWVDGGPDALIAHRKKIADQGVTVSPIIDEHALPNFAVTTPDGYSICFFTQYV
jgi:RNA polymerase sigma factor (sigma-70 family)